MSDRINKLLELLSESPNDNFLKHAMALEYIKIGDDEQARHLFEEILQRSPDFLGSYYQLGRLLERCGDTNAAVSCYIKGIELAKKTGDDRTWRELAAAYQELID